MNHGIMNKVESIKFLSFNGKMRECVLDLKNCVREMNEKDS